MRLAVALAAAFAILTVAVAAHALRPVDRFALDHLQPFQSDNVAGRIAPAQPQRIIRPILDGQRSLAESVAGLLFAPADSLSALLLAAGAAAVLRRRGLPWRLAGVWIGAVVAGLAVEGAGKLTVPQIPFGPPSTILGVTIDGTYPSGHTIRSVLLAAMVAALWPRMEVRAVAAVWVVYVTLLLELGGLHLPSEIAGGFLVAGALACAAVALQSGGHGALQATAAPHLHQAAGAPDGRGGRPRADRGGEQPEGG
jgi:membrane-associated phospholipid phosphatase